MRRLELSEALVFRSDYNFWIMRFGAWETAGIEKKRKEEEV